MSSFRRQITLFVPPEEAVSIEAMRQRFNAAQYDLIAAHVTLCRDDEVLQWEELKQHCHRLGPIDLKLQFGRPQREGDWVYLPVIGSTDAFDQLRRRVLQRQDCRQQIPHVTLVHPRNGSCSDQQFLEIYEGLPGPIDLRFQQLAFIVQQPGQRWQACEITGTCQ